ncbi:hypothetical protein EYR40_010461 [Pleurotus pulmonarius]|nr:hypothetical protein EYR36_010152 [Pleurotus pulmonarius]KAF4588906.1 hypothetical protein EYR40_010461 [Pleurotus pulmonarius]
MAETIKLKIQQLTQELELHPSGHPAHTRVINKLADALRKQYQHSGAEEDLIKAIELYVEGFVVRKWYQFKGAEAGLRKAIKLYSERLDVDYTNNQGCDVSLVNLAKCLLSQFENNGGEPHLKMAIQLYTGALRLSPNGHSECANLWTRYKQSGAKDDLDKAIELHTEALELRPVGHPIRATSLNNLALSLQSQYEHSGAQDDLDKAIELHTEALYLRPVGHPTHASSLNNLALRLQSRYQQSEAKDDLDKAIELHTEALDLRPVGHPTRDTSLNNLATSLQSRYEHSGAQDDLNKAIELHTEALDLCPVGHPTRGTSLNNLASSLQSRYEHTGAQDDLEKAIDLNTEALDLCPVGHPTRATLLNNLASSLQSRYKHSGAQDDLDKAIQLHTEALDLCPVGNPTRDTSLNNLAGSLHSRYKHSGAQDDLDKAIELHTEALQLCPTGHPQHAHSLASYASVLLIDSTNPSSSVPKAISMLVEGSQDLSMLPDSLMCARLLMRHARDDSEYFVGYSNFIHLLQHYIAMRPTMKQQHTSLISVKGFLSLPMDVAARAINTSNITKAVEWLDAGRSLLWAQSQNVHETLPPSSLLTEDIKKQFSSTCTELQQLNNVVNEQSITRRQQVLRRFNNLVDKIRCTPGLENFLKPLPFNRLQLAAKEGPVIIVNCSEDGSHIVIVFADQDPFVHKLDDFFWEDAHGIFDAYVDARQRAKGSKSSHVLERTLSTTCKWLWDTVVVHVVKQLKKCDVQTGSRIWWCPTSFLTVLPFHAAGNLKKGKFLVDDYISSYTPTLKALIDSRSSFTSNPLQRQKILIVAQTDDPQLKSAEEELRSIHKLMQPLKLSQVELVNQDATHISVKELLPSCNWVHFICHGDVSPTSPFESSLHLGNKTRLTLNDIITAHLPDAQFAFLAACHTAEQSVSELPDVILHLASAMQFSGFQSVIGTLWEMKDKDGPFVAEQFYKRMLEGDDSMDERHKKAAGALRDATLEMRKNNVGLDRWVNYVHIGA